MYIGFLQVPHGRCGKNTITSSKRLLNFQNEHLFVFYDKKIILVPQKQFGSMNDAFWTAITLRKQVIIVSVLRFFSRKTSFKLNLKPFKII